MQRFITDERTGIQYELIGDYYYPCITIEEPPTLSKYGRLRERYLELYHQLNKFEVGKEVLIMGLDIYAGTLTRYYMNNWKTVAQQFAEANGLKFETIRPQQENAEDDEELSLQETKEIVIEWREAIVQGLKLNPMPLWNEDYDTTPYYTDKPDWDALSALLLYIASKYSHKEVPTTIIKNIDIYKHPIVSEFLETKDFQLSLFNGNGWWLPIIPNPPTIRCGRRKTEFTTPL